MITFAELSTMVQEGQAKAIQAPIEEMLSSGIPATEILEKGLLDGMNVIGAQFQRNEVFVPEVLLAARAMNNGIKVLKPALAAEGLEPKGVAILGTVKGDLHDIGKNLVKIMLEGKGITVVDLGVDVSAEQFVEAAMENNAKLICCSALLTTTMGEMKRVIEVATEKGIRDKVRIMIGGAPVNQAYCDLIGADCYTPDSASAANQALAFCEA